ncbi:MAG: uridine kinase [Gammaproteobacteria bacterium]|nr:uridine kinase [Gammaproteobacteria bacterium]
MVMVAIYGASGSGKSTFLDLLATQLNEVGCSCLKEDNYYHNSNQLSYEERRNIDYDHPSSLDHTLLITQLKQLYCEKTPILSPKFDFSTLLRVEEAEKIMPNPIILVDGLLLMTNSLLAKMFTIKVYIDTPLDICLSRRLNRDLKCRGIDVVEYGLSRYESKIKPMFENYVSPYKDIADFVVSDSHFHDNVTQLKSKVVAIHTNLIYGC